MQIIESSDNVFYDLGFSEKEAASLLLRSDLMIAIERKARTEKMTQRVLAARLGVSQPRVSDLCRGKVDKFSLDCLVDFLSKLGCRVSLTVA